MKEVSFYSEGNSLNLCANVILWHGIIKFSINRRIVFLVELDCRWLVNKITSHHWYKGTVNCSLISVCLQVSSWSITALGSSTQIKFWTTRTWPVMCSACRPTPSPSSSPIYAFPPKVRTTAKHTFIWAYWALEWNKWQIQNILSWYTVYTDIFWWASWNQSLFFLFIIFGVK